jgi:hypothetical protein
MIYINILFKQSIKLTTYCAFCIAFQDQSDAKQNTEFVQVPFHDWKNTMGDKRCPLKNHAQSERHLMVLEVRDNFVPSVTQSKLLLQTLNYSAMEKCLPMICYIGDHAYSEIFK